jgi:flagellar biosynthesis/type III secretory pathway ATPase
MPLDGPLAPWPAAAVLAGVYSNFGHSLVGFIDSMGQYATASRCVALAAANDRHDPETRSPFSIFSARPF